MPGRLDLPREALVKILPTILNAQVSDEEMDYEDMTQTQGSSTLAQKNYDRMDQKLQEKKVTGLICTTV